MQPYELPARKKDSVEVDIAPLMDMVFILLIFFIVTSTFTREAGVDVEKPKAKSASQLDQKSIQIAVTRAGTIHVNERQVDLVGLQEVLKQLLRRSSKREVIILADNKSETGQLVNVMDAANLAGAQKISVATLAE